jgi:hypothetical protein
MSERAKSIEISLNVKVKKAVSPAFSDVLFVVITIVGGVISAINP